MKKRRAKRRRLAITAKAMATKLGLRKHKGLADPNVKDVQLISETEYDALSRDDQDKYLSDALRSLAPMAPEVRRLFGRTKLRPGERFDERSGAIIYADSEVIRPYIGSEQEERDHKLTQGPLRSAPAKKDGMTCVKCFGWGCVACNGWGAT